MKKNTSASQTHQAAVKKRTDGDISFEANSSDTATFDNTLVTVHSASTAPIANASTPPAAVTKVGNEFTANAITAGGQFFSSVATFPDGGYVISWTDTSYTDGEENAGIRAQIFDKNNNKVGGEFRVNTTVKGGQYLPQTAILANGDFVIVWNDEGATGGDTSGDAVRGQMYHRDGSKVGGEFIVNTSTAGDQENASITALASGGFVVTWQDGSKTGGDASGLSVKAQLYDAGGHKVGGEFLVNTVTKNDQELPSVTALQGVNSGGFLAVWEDHSFLNGDNTRSGSIKAQRFDKDGHKVGGEILVDTKDITYVNTAPSVIGLSDGGFAVTWQGQSDHPSLSTDTDDSNIQLQIFDKDGHKIGVQIQVNTKGEEYQQAPKITQLTNGYIVVAWEDVEDGTGDHGQIKARVFDTQGHPVGDEFTVNGVALGEQHTPSIAALPDGRFIITWTDNNIAGENDDGIRSQIFSVSGITGPNAAPTNETLSGGTVLGGSANGTVVGTVFGTDPNAGDVLTYSLTDNDGGRFAIDAKTGVITVADSSRLTAGTDTITVRATDLGGLSIDKTFNITVEDPAKQAVAANEHRSINEDSPLVISAATLIADSSNPSGAALTVSSVGHASHGTVTLVNGNVTFVPDANFSGIATFDYAISDGAGHTSTATVTVDVAPVADTPTVSVSQRLNPSVTVTNVGNEFTANGITAGGEFFSNVASFSDGGYVIAYTDTSYTDGEENAGIRLRIFDKDGHGGRDIHVNTAVAGGQYKPQIAILANGDFAVIWEDEGATGGDTSGDAIRGQMFHRDGTKFGGEFIVNSTTAGDQENASITALPNGGFVVTWQDSSGQGGDTSGSSVKAQLYDAGGHKVGGEILVNTITKNDQGLTSVTALQGDNSGGYVVTWQDDSFLNGDNTRSGSIKAQMFDKDGHKVGGEILVDTKDRAYVNTAPSVIGLANGGYAVTWQAQSDNPTHDPAVDDDDSNIQLQVFDKDGHKVGVQIQVNQKGEEYQQAPKITQTTNGYIVVTWEDVEDGDGDHGQIKARVFDQQGHPVSDEITVNDFADGEQHTPAITALPDGRVLITWTDNNAPVTGEDDDGIRARIIQVGNQPGPAVVDIAASLTDTDGSEVLALNISGIPVGVRITDGVHSFTATEGHTSVDVTGWAIHGLTVVRSNGIGDVTLTVTASSTEAADPTHPSTVSQTITLTNVSALSALAAEAPVIVGGTGNDVLFGGSGNDVLTGGGGNDTYQFGHGGGQDRIVNGTSTSTAASGELDFGADINANQLWFQRDGNDLSITVMGSHDQITVGGWFSGAGAQLTEITTASGLKIDAGLSQLVQAMSAYSAAHAGFDPTTATQAPSDAALQNTIAASWHN